MYEHRLIRALVAILAAGSALGFSQTVGAEVVVEDDANIELVGSQVEEGDDASENPDVTQGLGGTLVTFTTEKEESRHLGDGDVGQGRASHGSYAVVDAGSKAVVLKFQAEEELAGIAVYNGYADRDEGTYRLRDAHGNVLGTWIVRNTEGETNEGVDSFWLVFKEPVRTDHLVIDTQSNESDLASFREIQVFSANSPPIRLAVIGDSFTAGFGDSCSGACSTLPAAVWTTNPAFAPRMQPCGQRFGWAEKLLFFLRQRGRNATLVGQCTKPGATSEDMFFEQCGQKIANSFPTHTVIFAGINDAAKGWSSGRTWFWVSEIGRPIGGRKIHVQGNGEWFPNNWQQTIPNGTFLRGVQAPCTQHPNAEGYWNMAFNLLVAVNW